MPVTSEQEPEIRQPNAGREETSYKGQRQREKSQSKHCGSFHKADCIYLVKVTYILKIKVTTKTIVKMIVKINNDNNNNDNKNNMSNNNKNNNKNNNNNNNNINNNNNNNNNNNKK